MDGKKYIGMDVHQSSISIARQGHYRKTIHKEAHVLTLSQAKQVLAVLRYPEKELALIAILTGMKAPEICGLQWKHVNLTDTWLGADGQPIPPKTIRVQKQWCRGQSLIPVPVAAAPAPFSAAAERGGTVAEGSAGEAQIADASGLETRRERTSVSSLVSNGGSTPVVELKLAEPRFNGYFSAE